MFKHYTRKGLSEMRPYIPGEDLTGISVSSEDTPEEGGMIARNPKNHSDMWYVSPAYFKANLEEFKGTVYKRGFNVVEVGTHYQLPIYRVEDSIGIVETGEVLDLKFVRGSKIREEEVEKREGTLHEHLLSVMINDLKYKNSILGSREGSTAITKLEEALHWLEERQHARVNAGVIGTYKPHNS